MADTKEDLLKAARESYEFLKTGKAYAPEMIDEGIRRTLDRTGADFTALNDQKKYGDKTNAEMKAEYNAVLASANFQAAKQDAKDLKEGKSGVPDVLVRLVDRQLKNSGYGEHSGSENPLNFDKKKLDEALQEAAGIGSKMRKDKGVSLPSKNDGTTAPLKPRELGSKQEANLG